MEFIRASLVELDADLRAPLAGQPGGAGGRRRHAEQRFYPLPLVVYSAARAQTLERYAVVRKSGEQEEN